MVKNLISEVGAIIKTTPQEETVSLMKANLVWWWGTGKVQKSPHWIQPVSDLRPLAGKCSALCLYYKLLCMKFDTEDSAYAASYTMGTGGS